MIASLLLTAALAAPQAGLPRPTGLPKVGDVGMLKLRIGSKVAWVPTSVVSLGELDEDPKAVREGADEGLWSPKKPAPYGNVPHKTFLAALKKANADAPVEAIKVARDLGADFAGYLDVREARHGTDGAREWVTVTAYLYFGNVKGDKGPAAFMEKLTATHKVLRSATGPKPSAYEAARILGSETVPAWFAAHAKG